VPKVKFSLQGLHSGRYGKGMCKVTLPYLAVLLCLNGDLVAQSWSGIISSPRATDWTSAGIPGGIPSGNWTQCGATITAYGTTGSPGGPTQINNAIAGTGAGYTGCSTPYVILLGNGDFYLNAPINLRSNVVLRGGGANETRLHFVSGGSYNCNGMGGVSCIVGSNTWATCTVQKWICPSGSWSSSLENTANWTGGYAQGATTITLDSVTGIVPNLTPIVLDQCDVGFTGAPNVETCTATAGVITSAVVWPSGITTNGGSWPAGNGSGYAIGDTGNIQDYYYYGSGTATYKVTSVSGSGGVTGFTITNGGNGYIPGNTGFLGGPNSTTRTSGSGSGFTVQITGITEYDNGSIFPCGLQIICAVLQDSGTAHKARSQTETVIATSITGTGPYTLTLSRPLMRPNWAPGQGPHAWWGAATITNAGIENIGFDMTATGGTSAVVIQTAYKVWVKGISSNVANFMHVYALTSSNFVVRDSYFYETTNHGTTSYGIGSSGAISSALFENNIIQGVVDPLVANGNCTGCVFDYNFSVNQDDGATTVMFASSPMHSSSTDYILEEGNIGAAANLDNTHGPHFMNTFFRNYFVGYELNGNGINTTLPTNSTVPAIVGAFSRYNNFVGNVLGTPGYHTIYQCKPTSSSQQVCTPYGSYVGYVQIWGLGFSGDASQLDFSNNPPVPNDTLVASSLLRWGNWDSVRGAVSWCGGSSDTGWGTTCMVSGTSTSEVPIADPNFPVPVPTLGDTGAGQGALPASFLYSSEPSWWPAGKAWPPIGPDVTTGNIGQCTGGTYGFSKTLSSGSCTGGAFLPPASTNASHAVSIPAMDCYFEVMGGPPNGTGSMLMFNASSCYSQSSGGTVSPPTTLTVVLN